MFRTFKELLVGAPVVSWGILAVVTDAAAVVWSGNDIINFAALVTSGLTLLYGGKLVRNGG